MDRARSRRIGTARAADRAAAGDDGRNPSFPLSIAEAKSELKRMRGDPKPLARPLVILDGYLVPRFAAGYLRRVLRRVTGDGRVVGLSFLFHYRFASCRRKVIRAVDRRFAGGEGVWTREVDAVGYSMGGLIARYAAAAVEPVTEHRRLRLARLFTIATPHRGANRATWPSPTRLQRDMRAGSDFLAELVEAARENPLPICPYVRLGDRIVGEPNAAPEGADPWWVPARRPEPSHMLAFRDPRIVADIARRLRGEPPFTRCPPAALPEAARPGGDR